MKRYKNQQNVYLVYPPIGTGINEKSSYVLSKVDRLRSRRCESSTAIVARHQAPAVCTCGCFTVRLSVPRPDCRGLSVSESGCFSYHFYAFSYCFFSKHRKHKQNKKYPRQFFHNFFRVQFSYDISYLVTNFLQKNKA